MESILAGTHLLIADLASPGDLVEFLERRGASVAYSPLLGDRRRIDEASVVTSTVEFVSRPGDVLLVASGPAFEAWLDVAYAHGIADDLLATLSQVTLVTRGTRAREAVRTSGLQIAWDAGIEPTGELIAHLASQQQCTVWLLQHGIDDDALGRALEAEGMDVHRVVPFSWGPPQDLLRVIDAITQASQGGFDAVIVTSDDATRRWLDTVTTMRLLSVMRARVEYGDLAFVALSELAAEPLRDVQITPVVASAPRMGALVRAVVESVGHDRGGVDTPEGVLNLRARTATLDGQVIPVSPSGLSLLRALARVPGDVVSREKLLSLLPGGSQRKHALDVAMARLRAAVGAEAIETVPKKGYRLRAD